MPASATSQLHALASTRWSRSCNATACARSSRRCSTTSSASAAPRRPSTVSGELVEVVDGPLVRAHHGHAVAVAAGDPDALRTVIDDYEALDVLHFAAEAAAELAELHQQRGDSRLAAAAMHRCGELSTRAGGLRTPPLARGAGVEPLTAREREVALLAAGGRSSRDIADRLYLSTRTVETHLARVYRKLGITTRSELAAALGTADAT